MTELCYQTIQVRLTNAENLLLNFDVIYVQKPSLNLKF